MSEEIQYPPEVMRRKEASEEARLKYTIEYAKDPESVSTEAAWMKFQELDRLYTAGFVNFINSLLREKQG